MIWIKTWMRIENQLEFYIALAGFIRKELMSNWQGTMISLETGSDLNRIRIENLSETFFF